MVAEIQTEIPTAGPKRRTRAPRKVATVPLTTTPDIAPTAPTAAEHTPPLAAPAFGFATLGISDATLASIERMGWVRPSPIQQEAIPPLLGGSDVVGRARTGTGKTGAFGIPLIERLDPARPHIQAIVLVPTRELAVQVAGELARLGMGRGIHTVAVYGGQKISTQLSALARGAHVIVGTPGRVQDHMQRGTIRLDQVQIAVLDEADEMLDIGFADDMERILRRTPRERQTALFSATLPPFIRRMIIRYMRDPVWVSVVDPDESPTVETVEQVVYEVSERDKVDAFVEVYNRIEDDPRILVFRKTKIGVDRFVAALRRRGGQVAGLHGDMRQGERDRMMSSFKAGEVDVLVATNVAARGLDIPDVTHVFNVDVPQNAEEYVHRIGRTARAGKQGTAVTFVSEWDYEEWEGICREISISPARGELRLYGAQPG